MGVESVRKSVRTFPCGHRKERMDTACTICGPVPVPSKEAAAREDLLQSILTGLKEGRASLTVEKLREIDRLVWDHI